jgi:hypothetical protein
MKKVTHHDVKKGTLSDDESYVVRQGTEPNRLIASAAGLEAIIPKGDAASGRANSRMGCGSRTPGETLHGESSVQVVLGVIISLSYNPDVGQTILPRQRLFSP